jgi:hypothetical protein
MTPRLCLIDCSILTLAAADMRRETDGLGLLLLMPGPF